MIGPVVTSSQAVVVAHSPDGTPRAEDFALAEVPVPRPGPDEVLVQVTDLSLDPYLRSLLSAGHLDEPPVGIGEVMPGRAVATVLESHSPAHAPGDRVLAETGWRQYAVLPAAALTPTRVPPGVPASAALGVLGMPGLTAWAAHVRHLVPAPGDTVVVTAATGGVGQVAGVLARQAGARTVAIVGDEQKTRTAREMGYEAAVVRGGTDFAERLRAACPEGIDCYLHMADQATLDVVAEQWAIGARVSLVGVIDQTNGAPPTRLRVGAVMTARATVHGMVVYDHHDLAADQTAALGALLADGTLSLHEDRRVGLAAAPAAFADLLAGRNHGKVVVTLSAPPASHEHPTPAGALHASSPTQEHP